MMTMTWSSTTHGDPLRLLIDVGTCLTLRHVRPSFPHSLWIPFWLTALYPNTYPIAFINLRIHRHCHPLPHLISSSQQHVSPNIAFEFALIVQLSTIKQRSMNSTGMLRICGSMVNLSYIASSSYTPCAHYRFVIVVRSRNNKSTYRHYKRTPICFAW
jgi:hypothetical protein